MKKKEEWIHMVTVEGRGVFPLDMLRYDGLEPSSPTDEAKCNKSWEAMCESGNTNEFQSIQLFRFADRKSWEPTNARWASFGWKVVDHKVRNEKLESDWHSYKRWIYSGN